MSQDLDALINDLKNTTYDNLTFAFCEQIANITCRLSSEEFKQAVNALTEVEQADYALFIVIGLGSYHKIQTMPSKHHLYEWLDENSCLFTFLRERTEDLTQDPLEALKDISALRVDSYSAEKNIFNKIETVNLSFLTEIKFFFNNGLQLYRHPNRYEEYLFDTYLPERDSANDLNQNLIELALTHSTAFCHFIQNEPLKAACFSGYDAIAARQPMALYEIMLGLKHYEASVPHLFSSLIRTGKIELAEFALASCKKSPGWITGLTNEELIFCYKKHISLFETIINKHPVKLTELLGDQAIIKNESAVHTEICKSYAYILSDADRFDAKENDLSFFTELMPSQSFAEHADVNALLDEKKNFNQLASAHGQQWATLFKSQNTINEPSTLSTKPPLQPSTVAELIKEFEEQPFKSIEPLTSIEEEFEESLEMFPCSSELSIFQPDAQKNVLPEENSHFPSWLGLGIGMRR